MSFDENDFAAAIVPLMLGNPVTEGPFRASSAYSRNSFKSSDGVKCQTNSSVGADLPASDDPYNEINDLYSMRCALNLTRDSFRRSPSMIKQLSRHPQ
jgi:hypothetical protein